MTTHAAFRSYRPAPVFPARLVEGHVAFAAMLWAGFLLAVLVITIGIALWGEVTGSVWEPAASHVPRWFALFIGVHMGYSVLPLHIAHGQTRREFAVQGVLFILAFASALALMVTAGFVIEAGWYRLAGWPREFDGRHLYDSPWDLHLIFLESWLVLTLWTAGGAFIAAAFYREDGLGAGTIAVAILIAGLADGAIGGYGGPFAWVFERLAGDPDVSLALAVPVYLGAIALVLALTWPIIRDIAIRPKAP